MAEELRESEQARAQLDLIREEHAKIARLRQELAALQEVERQCEQERREIAQIEAESAKR